MRFAEKHREYLLNAYSVDNLSTKQIAEELDTYPNQIRRSLKFLGVTIRTKSEAQKLALASGRHTHPTKGKTRSDETKAKISDGMSEHWDTMPPDERERRSELAKEQWDNMDDYKKQELLKAAGDALREASKNGSKMEKFLQTELTNEGFDVIFHKKGLIENNNLELDLFIPSLKTAIEVDGPTHFFPIWSQESLDKHIKADAEKSGLLIKSGYCLIRIKNLAKYLSDKRKRDFKKVLITELRKIEKKFPSQNKRYIELEIE